MSRIMVGRQVGHFRIVERLGSGGMGVVFKAEDTRLGRTVALKFLPAEWSNDEEWRLRFLREAQAASALDHVGICTIHSINETEDGQYFICMGFYDGETLQQRLSRGPLPLVTAIDLAVQTADALARAHETGVVHRDIKPANLMITERSQVKVLDFGLAKCAGSTLTAPGSVVGTAHYMSPEQATSRAVDHRTDIWSLGVVLHEMVTGSRPFTGPSVPVVLLAILTHELTPPGHLQPGLPVELDRIVCRALAKDPADRYQAIEEMCSDLRALAAALTTSDGSAAAALDASSSATVRRRPVQESDGAPKTGERTTRSRAARLVGAGLVVAACLAGVTWHGMRNREPGAVASDIELRRTTVVVLPFDNLGSSTDAFFAAGVADEISRRLATIPDLAVISRTSAVAFAGQAKTVRQIGEELGVTHVLEGTVRWSHASGAPSRVRITPRLVRVSDDTDLWSESYDRVMDDIFAVQSEIALQVTARLDITLQPGQRRSMEAVPTTNLEAYEAYLLGRNLLRAPPTMEAQDEAVAQLELAVSLDPSFAVAWAELARAEAYIYRVGHDHSEGRREAATRAMDEAVRLAPNAPETHLAQAFYQYWVRFDLDQALAEAAAAEVALPSDADALSVAGLILRRRGHFEEALSKLSRVATLSPRSADAAFDVGGTLVNLRRFAEAERWLERSVALQPVQLAAYINLVELYWMWNGSTVSSRAVLERMPQSSDPNLLHYWFFQHLYEGDPTAALALIDESSPSTLDLVEWFEPTSLLEAWAWQARGDRERARRAFETARAVVVTTLSERPQDPRVHATLGEIHAGLGQKDDAWREGQIATALLPVSDDAVVGPYLLMALARIYAQTDRVDSALDVVEQLLSIPAPFSLRMLQLDPRMDPVRSSPRYERLASGR